MLQMVQPPRRDARASAHPDEGGSVGGDGSGGDPAGGGVVSAGGSSNAGAGGVVSSPASSTSSTGSGGGAGAPPPRHVALDVPRARHQPQHAPRRALVSGRARARVDAARVRDHGGKAGGPGRPPTPPALAVPGPGR